MHKYIPRIIIRKGITYKLGRFRHLISGRATEWDKRVLRMQAEEDLKTRTEELNYEMYRLSLKDPNWKE